MHCFGRTSPNRSLVQRLLQIYRFLLVLVLCFVLSQIDWFLQIFLQNEITIFSKNKKPCFFWRKNKLFFALLLAMDMPNSNFITCNLIHYPNSLNHPWKATKINHRIEPFDFCSFSRPLFICQQNASSVVFEGYSCEFFANSFNAISNFRLPSNASVAWCSTNIMALDCFNKRR